MLDVTVSIRLCTMNRKFVHVTYICKACIDGGFVSAFRLIFWLYFLREGIPYFVRRGHR